MRICPICHSQYEPKYSSMQPTCNNFMCMGKHSTQKRVKKDANKKRSAFNQTDVRYWHSRVRSECHKYIRERDKGLGCISCGTISGQMQAGHYKPGTHSITRYDVENIHGQCARCNNRKSGNLTEYRPALIAKIGLSKVEYLESANGVRKWTIDDLKLELAKFKRLNKDLKNDKGV